MARPAPTDARIRRRRLAALALLVFAVLLTAALLRSACGGDEPPFTGELSEPSGGRAWRVTAWNRTNPDSIETAIAAKAIDEVGFVWYLSQADGTVESEHEDLDLVRETRERGVQAFATVVNREKGGDFNGDIAARILETEEARADHIETLVDLVVDKGFDGLDLDWELVSPDDRDRFSEFVEELAEALHAENRLLSIAVFPKESEPGRWDTQKAADYERLGAAVDEFKVMTYSYSGGWSDPGPQMPLAWARRVLAFAKSVVPAEKVLMGIPFFGFDWHGDATTAAHWTDADAKRREVDAELLRHAGSGEASFTYTDDDGVMHAVWFQDRKAVGIKVNLLTRKHPDLAGIAIWQMYGEDPRFWDTIRKGLRAPE
jgi:spore germination protein YaaH